MTNEFSFYLAVSKIHGVGVFAAHTINTGEELKLFYESSVPRNGIPKLFQRYIVEDDMVRWCPRNFGRMSIGWYLNHSTQPNVTATPTCEKYYATKRIVRGEEITIDYIKLGFGKP